jgi:hypothetical protein
MWNPPTAQELSRLPGLYQTEHIPAREKIFFLHFFLGGCDWWAAEFDGEDLFFGYAVLNGDFENSEWGYFSLAELKSISIHGLEVDRDLYWQPTPAEEVEAVRGRV